ncbi:hypothetical protein D9M71_187560 [compost metagenome]
MFGAGQRQVAFKHVIRRGQQHKGAALAHVGGQAQQTGLFGAPWGKHQQRVVVANQGHRTVTDFGAAEGFGLDRRGLLELERRFLGDGETGATADHHQPLTIAQGVDGPAPVLLRGVAQAIGQGAAGVEQFGVFFPVANQPGAGAEGGDKALGRRDAAFGAGTQRQAEFAGGFQRRVFGIDQRNAQGAALAQQAQAVDQVRALPRLRKGECHLAADLQRCLLHGHHRHRQRRHRDAQQLHGQVGEVTGGMVGAAARHGHGHLRRLTTQAPGDLDHLRVELL